MSVKSVYRLEHKVDGYGPWMRGRATHAELIAELPDRENINVICGYKHCNLSEVRTADTYPYPSYWRDWDDNDDYENGLQRACCVSIEQLNYWFEEYMETILNYYHIVQYKVTAYELSRSGVQGRFNLADVIERVIYDNEYDNKYIN